MDKEEPHPFADPVVKKALSDYAERLRFTEGFPAVMTAREAAFCMNVSISTIRRWIREGRLAVCRPGPHTVRIRRTDLMVLLTPIHAA